MRIHIASLLFLAPLSLFTPVLAANCTAKIIPGTDSEIWGGDPLPYSKNIIFGAQVTDRVMDGPELVTVGGTPIPRRYLFDVSPACYTLAEWDGDRYYFNKWYR